MKDKTLLNTLVLGGSVIIASFGLFLFGKTIMNQIKRRRDEKDENNIEGDEDSGESAQEQLEIQQAKNYNPFADAKAIRGYLDGYNVNSYNTEILAIINKLTNAKLKKLAEHYNKNYKISLYKQMDNEWNTCGYTFSSNCYDTPMKRLSGLGLR
jgi:hypothetical protein